MINVSDHRHVTDVGLHIHNLTDLVNGEVDLNDDNDTCHTI